MQFFDDRLSTLNNYAALLAVILTLANNIPQLLHTHRRKTAVDFYGPSLVMRILSNSIWAVYAVELNSVFLLSSSLVSLFSALFIWYVKYFVQNIPSPPRRWNTTLYVWKSPSDFFVGGIFSCFIKYKRLSCVNTWSKWGWRSFQTRREVFSLAKRYYPVQYKQKCTQTKDYRAFTRSRGS